MLVAVLLIVAPAAAPIPDKSLVSSPHPLIMEVLYAVPSGKAGDANGDGERQPLGDEFIELINPHDAAINLKGYMLVDADAYAPTAAKPDGKPRPKSDDKSGEMRFTFPECSLAPGKAVVLFNGYKSAFTGPVGETGHAPSGPSDKFHGAMVFSMNNASPYAAFGNDGDFVLLIAPDGKAVQCIKWGKTAKNPPSECPLVEEAPVSVGSVQRDSETGKLVAHRDLGGDFKGTNFSPGLFKAAPAETKPAHTPASANPKPNSKPAAATPKPDDKPRSPKSK